MFARGPAGRTALTEEETQRIDDSIEDVSKGKVSYSLLFNPPQTRAFNFSNNVRKQRTGVVADPALRAALAEQGLLDEAGKVLPGAVDSVDYPALEEAVAREIGEVDEGTGAITTTDEQAARIKSIVNDFEK